VSSKLCAAQESRDGPSLLQRIRHSGIPDGPSLLLSGLGEKSGGLVMRENPDAIDTERGANRKVEETENGTDHNEVPRPVFVLQDPNAADEVERGEHYDKERDRDPYGREYHERLFVAVDALGEETRADREYENHAREHDAHQGGADPQRADYRYMFLHTRLLLYSFLRNV
jgi:hypothetical protein